MLFYFNKLSVDNLDLSSHILTQNFYDFGFLFSHMFGVSRVKSRIYDTQVLKITSISVRQ